MDDHFTVRTMQRQEVSIAIEWAKQEGWNPGIHDAKTYYAIDHKGFFLGELHNEIIAVSTGVCYDANFAFWGFYIVKPEHRGPAILDNL